MRWPWQRDPDELAALEESERRLAETRRRWPAVREAAASMDRHREINGFTQAIRTAMGVDR